MNLLWRKDCDWVSVVLWLRHVVKNFPSKISEWFWRSWSSLNSNRRSSKSNYSWWSRFSPLRLFNLFWKYCFWNIEWFIWILCLLYQKVSSRIKTILFKYLHRSIKQVFMHVSHSTSVFPEPVSNLLILSKQCGITKSFDARIVIV
jgi:hypothetical protein